MTVRFPDCWNGRDLDTADHKSHVEFRNSDGTCPPSHPVPFMEINLEVGYRQRNLRPNQLILSTGDRVGYGIYQPNKFNMSITY
jgi:hypothetical protein